MILRKLQWVIILKLLYLTLSVLSQKERSYDTNEWIPITPTPDASGTEPEKKATGRVLNLDGPAQNFFPEAEYNHRKRKPQVQQYLRESSVKPSTDRHRQKHVEGRYRHEPQQSASNIQYLATYEQPPPLNQANFIEKPILTRQQAPAVNALNIYEQYNLPFNGSFYRSLNPSSINQELQNDFQNHNSAPTAPRPVQDEKPTVQLLYVPLENLKSNQIKTQDTQESIYRQVGSPREENQIFSQNKQHLIDDIEHDLIQQTVQAHRLQQQIHLGRPVLQTTTTTTTTTPKPTKRKPHQPPLAVYLEKTNGADIDDVLNALKDAKTIAVQDAVLPTSPYVFIGPSTLNLPSSYNRFPLPYINKLDSNRIERKIDHLPFFVAPLSYKTPSGYSKIPLPSPHVGSVVVSNKEDSHKRSAPKPTPIYQNQINDHEAPKPSYPTPTAGNLNSQVFHPSQQTYFSTTPLLNPAVDVQKSQYLQFTANDKVNQFPVSATQIQGQLQQQQPNINNIPSRNPSGLLNTQFNSFTSPGSIVSYNQPVNNVNTKPQTTSQGTNINPYNNPLKAAEENVNKYSFNQNQNIQQNYQIPTKPSVPSINTHQDTINPYQIPVKTSTGVTQYGQLVDDKNENYKDFNPHSFSDENRNPYQIPARSPQRSRHPTTENLHNNGAPTKTTTSHYEVPSSFFSSPYEETQEVNITPKTSITKPASDESHPHSFLSDQKKQNPLDLAINQYELHQINSQLVEENTEKDIKDPYDFNSHFRYDTNKPKDFDYSSGTKSKDFDYTAGSKPKDFDYNSAKFEVEKSKVKGNYGYSSSFDIDLEKPKYNYGSEVERHSSTPATILRDTFEEITTTPKAPPKIRRRGKPTRQPTRPTTTASLPHKESYTVLEEFSAISSTTPNITETSKEIKHEPEYKLPTQPIVSDIPETVYRLRTTTPQYETIKANPLSTQYDNIKTVVQEIPASVYNPNINQNTPLYANPANQQVLNQNLMDKQILQNNFGRNGEISHTPTYVQSPLTEVSYTPQYNENSQIEPLVYNRGQKPQENVYNVENKQQSSSVYTGNLQDHPNPLLAPNPLVSTTEHDEDSPDYEAPIQQFTTPTTTTTSTTTSTTTTVRPTTTRGRGRQRGGSRFSSASGTTSASVPRRNANRRRPVHASRTTTSTTTTESPNSQYTSREDIQKVNTRQRFRTRGRTTIPDRVSSTENEVRSYKEPTSEIPSEIQTNPSGPQSYMKFEHTVDDQKLYIQSEDPPITEPPQYYNPQIVPVTESPRLTIQYDNTATTHNPVMDIQITHPVQKTKKFPANAGRYSEESQVHLQAGGVLHNNNNNHNDDYETTPRVKNRVRGRGRARTRVATTTTHRPDVQVTRTSRPVIRVAPKRTTTTGTTTTTQRPAPKSIAEEEFFGFIRQPNFNQIYNIQVPSATEQSAQVYQNIPRLSTYHNVYNNQNKNPNVRVQSYQIPQQNTQQYDDVLLNFNSVPSDDTTVHFLGEIRPKYRPTTQNYDEIIATEITEPIRVETETPRPRIRGRIRAPQRKNNPRPSENEISTSRTQQATRRSNVVRSRGRGTAHYRSPENQRQKEDKEADVEGGNYPPSFFQNRQAPATNAPSFQISIDPGSDDEYGDQLSYPSLYQPKILPKPDEWTEATENSAKDEEYAPANDIHKDIHLEKETVSLDEPSATEQPKEEGVTEETFATQQSKDVVNDEQSTDNPVALPITVDDSQTTESSDEAYKKDTKAVEELFEEINKTEKPKKGKGRRRGAWKLIRQRPVDTYEGAESQNYYSVVNAFGDIVKIKDKNNWQNNMKNVKDTDEDEDYGQVYNNYNPILEQNSETYDYESQKLPSTEIPGRQATKYYEVYDLEAETENVILSSTMKPEIQSTNNDTKSDKETSTTVPKESSLFDTIYEMFGISDKSEDVKESSTTTTVSTTELITEPETVPPPTTTMVVPPTFPEEITEIPTTVIPSESDNESSTTEEALDKIVPTSGKTQITRTYEVEPWEMKAVRTSTSTEISHETEICYKGRCVKSTDRVGS